MEIRDIDFLDDDKIMINIELENGQEQSINWNDLKEYMIKEGYFSEEYLKGHYLDLSKVMNFDEYWEEISAIYQEHFVILGLYNGERQRGTLVVWDTALGNFAKIINGEYSQTALIIKDKDIFLQLCYVKEMEKSGYYKVFASKYSKKGDTKTPIKGETSNIKEFNLKEYKVFIGNEVDMEDEELGEDFGGTGLYYSKDNNEVYFYNSGKLITYKPEDIVME